MKSQEDIKGLLVESKINQDKREDPEFNNFQKNQVLKMQLFNVLNMRPSSLYDYFLKDLVFDEFQSSECLKGLAQIDLLNSMKDLQDVEKKNADIKEMKKILDKQNEISYAHFHLKDDDEEDIDLAEDDADNDGQFNAKE